MPALTGFDKKMGDTSDRPRRRPRNGLKIEDEDEDENEPKASPNFYHTPSLTRRRFELGILGFIQDRKSVV